MSDYKAFIKAAGISRTEMIRFMRQHYPNFGKSTCSMIANQSSYGVELTKDAERVLAEGFGCYKGLRVKPKRKASVKPSRTKRVAVRLDEADYDRLKNKIQQTGCTSLQGYVEEILLKSIEEDK